MLNNIKHRLILLKARLLHETFRSNVTTSKDKGRLITTEVQVCLCTTFVAFVFLIFFFKQWTFFNIFGSPITQDLTSSNIDDDSGDCTYEYPKFSAWNDSLFLPDFEDITDFPYFGNDNIVIAGMITHHASKHLKSMLDDLTQISCLFNSSTFVIFGENKRSKQTWKMIDRWTKIINNEPIAPLTIAANQDINDINDINGNGNVKQPNTVKVQQEKYVNCTYLQNHFHWAKNIRKHKICSKEKQSIYFDIFEDKNDKLAKKYAKYMENNRDFFNYHRFMTKSEKFGMYRNELLNHITLTSKKLNIKYQWLIMIDLDIYNLNLLNIMKAFSKLLNTYDKSNYNVAMCSKGLKSKRDSRYFDTFSLVIDTDDSPLWTWQWQNSKSDDDNNDDDMSFSEQKLLNWINNQEFLKTFSCFGGLAIYPYQKIVESGCKYYMSKEAFKKWPQWKEWTRNGIKENTVMPDHASIAYCLGDYGVDFYVARDALLYRDKF